MNTTSIISGIIIIYIITGIILVALMKAFDKENLKEKIIVKKLEV